MSAQGSPQTQKTQLTFGVEIEFLVPWLLVGQNDPDKDVKGLSPVLRFARKELQIHDSEPIGIIAEELIYERLQDTLNQLGLDSTLTSTRIPSGLPSDVLKQYLKWDVTSDASVSQEDHLGYVLHNPTGPLRQWVAIEIQSPVEYATPKAFEVIQYALKTLTRKYRMHINPTCSVHVHVGKNSERLPLQMIRRIAGLSWAADLLLFTLQDPIRRANTYCKAIAEYSNLARDSAGDPGHSSDQYYKEADLCLRFLGTDIRHGEASLMSREQNVRQMRDSKELIEAFERTRQPGHHEPFNFQDNVDNRPAPLDNAHDQVIAEGARSAAAVLPQRASIHRHKPARTRNLARIVLPRYTDAELQRLAVNEIDTRGRGGDIGVFEGVRQIFEAPSSCVISELLAMDDRGRGSINFKNYSCRNINRRQQEKRTIEFRIGEGCLDGDWVATWASICVAFVDFAIYAPVDEYLGVLACCDLSAKQDGVYDVLDLLDDLGLFAEAEIAEKRIRQKSKDWGTRFVV